MTINAELYSIFANVSYKNDNPLTEENEIKTLLQERLDDINCNDNWQVISTDNSMNGFQGVAYGLDSNNDGQYEEVVIACRGSQPPTMLAPLEMIKDWLWADVVQIGTGSQLSQYGSAQDFYQEVLETYGNQTGSNISITGHSLGGTLTQLLCAEYGNYGVTFNAPGASFQADKMEWTGSNVDNYIIMNDIIGNIRDHVGNEYYIEPTDTESSIFSPHSAYIEVEDFSDNHVVDWSFENSLALFWFDKNNNQSIQTVFETLLQLNERSMDLSGRGLLDGFSTFTFSSLETYLKNEVIENAVRIINEEIGTPLNVLHYCVPGVGDYIIGNEEGNQLNGSNPNALGNGGNDKIWGNEGDDVINGLGGNDTLYGDAGVDAIHGDAGDDKIYGGAEKDYLYGDAGEDIIYGGAGNDEIYGGDNNDVLVGDTGNDYLEGGNGADIIFGGEDQSAQPQLLRKSAASTATLATASTESLSTATFGASLSEASLSTMNLPASVGGDTMVGGAGKDVYVVGDEGATIIDSDGCGTVLYNGKMLAGGIKEKGQSVYTDSSGNSYELDGSNLVINGSLTVENFDGGDMKNDRNFVVANG